MLSGSATSPGRAAEARNARRGLRLILNDAPLDGPVTQEAIQGAFMRVGNGDHLIIETGPQDYMQTASLGGYYVLEVRKGGPAKHYRAFRSERPSTHPATAHDRLSFEEVDAAITAYASGEPMPDFLCWRPLTLPT